MAQNSNQKSSRPDKQPVEITVATREIEPFIMKGNDGELQGFSAELWRAIAQELGLKFRFNVYGPLPELFEAVKTGKDEAAIAAISITSERQKEFEFSYPMFRSGLSILVPVSSDRIDVTGILFSSSTLKALGIFLLIIVIPAHIFWFIARGRDEGLPIAEPYIPGIFDAIFWCAESLGGAAQSQPHRAFPRIVAIIWVYAGIILVAYFTAFATTALTMQTLKGVINGPQDLAGHRVGVVKGSTSADYVAATKARMHEYPDFDSAASALIAGKVQAVVYDTPVILYYTKRERRVRIAGPSFRDEHYGILFPVGSSLRRPVSEALLKLIETGRYQEIYKKWFSSSEDDAK